MFRLLLISIFGACAVIAEGGSLTLIGSHPTSVLTAARSIHDLKQFDGRIYFTYGDWNTYPAVTLTSYDPGTNSFRIEFSANTDSVGYLREWNGKLYAPAADPIHYEDFKDYSVLDPAVGWRDRAPWGCYHVFDIAALPNQIFAAGSKGVFESSGTGGAILWRSIDGERTWTAIRSSPSLGRYYWCFPYAGRVHVQDGYWENGTFIQATTLSAYPNLYNPTPVTTNGVESVIALSNRLTGFGVSPSALVEFNRGAVRTLVASAHDFTFAQGRVWVLTSSGEVWHTDNLSVNPTWATLPLTGMPLNASCLEIFNGVIYVATRAGELYAARLDEQPLAVTPPAIVTLAADAFGRSIALQRGNALRNSQLIVGAPDFSAAKPLAGRVAIFEQPAGSSSWTPTSTLDSPSPSFSGWFGKDVALLDDVLAVVEAGYDLTLRDRGSAARVHVYQKRNGAWQPVSVLSVPFAHSVALLGDMLAVGTANPTPSGQPGHPGVNPYHITRDDMGMISLAPQAQVRPLNNRWGYKSTARVVLGNNFLIAGFSGDVSRDGGPGMVSIFTRNTTGTGFNGSPFQELVPPTFGADRFGFSLSYDGNRLAVGAPRDDTAAPQAGAVHLYDWDGTTFVLRSKIVCPFPEAEANFGHSVAIRGGTLLIGCPGLTVDGIPQRGAVFVFHPAGASWSNAGQLHPPPAVQAEFGSEVEMDDTYLVAGSRFSDPTAAVTDRIAIATVQPAFFSWASAHGLAGVDNLAGADPDSDGLANLIEYALLLDPRVPDADITVGPGSSRGLPQITIDAGVSGARLIVTYVRRVGDARLRTALEVSQDLQTWQQTNGTLLLSNIQNGVETLTLALPIAGRSERSFVRLRAQYTF